MINPAIHSARIWILATVFLIALSLAFGRVSSAQAELGTIRGRSLELISSDGKVWLKAHRRNGKASVEIVGSSGHRRFIIEVTDGGPCDVRLNDERGRARAQLAVAETGKGAIALLREDGGSRVKLISSEDWAGLVLFDNDGKQRAEMISRMRSYAAVRLRDRQQRIRLELAVPNSRPANLFRFGPDALKERAFSDSD
jgi:hypothetical protein